MDRKTDGAAGDAAGRGRRRASGRRGRSAGVAGSAGRDGPAGAIGARFFSLAMADFWSSLTRQRRAAIDRRLGRSGTPCQARGDGGRGITPPRPPVVGARKSVVQGTSVSVRVDLGGVCII